MSLSQLLRASNFITCTDMIDELYAQKTSVVHSRYSKHSNQYDKKCDRHNDWKLIIILKLDVGLKRDNRAY